MSYLSKIVSVLRTWVQSSRILQLWYMESSVILVRTLWLHRLYDPLLELMMCFIHVWLTVCPSIGRYSRYALKANIESSVGQSIIYWIMASERSWQTLLQVYTYYIFSLKVLILWDKCEFSRVLNIVSNHFSSLILLNANSDWFIWNAFNLLIYRPIQRIKEFIDERDI